jgi:predicted nucleotidyltransferase
MSKKIVSVKAHVEGPFLDLIKTAFKDNLCSVLIYGSYVSGNFVEGVSDVNILILLEKSLSEQIENFGVIANKTIKSYKITPLIMTKAEFQNSADVFPMEYYDIKERNKVIYGEDETRTLTLTKKNLRHQLEDRLRGNVASLRQIIIASHGKDKILGNYLKNLFGSLNALFKGLLRLKEIRVESESIEETIEKIGNEFQLDTKPFSDFISFRKGEMDKPKTLARNMAVSLEKLVTIVDKMDLK